MSGNAHTRRKARRAAARNWTWPFDLETFVLVQCASMPPMLDLEATMRAMEEIARKYPPTPEERARAEWKKYHFGFPGNLSPTGRDLRAEWDWLGWRR
jgi:hypothetical protein